MKRKKKRKLRKRGTKTKTLLVSSLPPDTISPLSLAFDRSDKIVYIHF